MSFKPGPDASFDIFTRETLRSCKEVLQLAEVQAKRLLDLQNHEPSKEQVYIKLVGDLLERRDGDKSVFPMSIQEESPLWNDLSQAVYRAQDWLDVFSSRMATNPNPGAHMSTRYKHYLTQLPGYVDRDAMVNCEGIVVSETMPIVSPYKVREYVYLDSSLQSMKCQEDFDAIRTAAHWKSRYFQDRVNEEHDAMIIEDTDRTEINASQRHDGSMTEMGEGPSSGILRSTSSFTTLNNRFADTEKNSDTSSSSNARDSSLTLSGKPFVVQDGVDDRFGWKDVSDIKPPVVNHVGDERPSLVEEDNNINPGRYQVRNIIID
ncbi:hypothetical protein K491DRAFT_682954 [Lophiostoma macrostomum CBS 122681]|uniref:Uncharacterized protein n=1 Tax=Lophiostoma macrostomum CBS 122681 TaxID=1314788 RepID=A0A6A6SS02_9PLEO|nr:hypothetical protein K491DRAFT_682954 [Lophiostoma macrostomum CBS 122681]